MVSGELEKVPCGERGNLRRFRVVREELILNDRIKSQEHEEACWFWRGGCQVEVGYWDRDGRSPVVSPQLRSPKSELVLDLVLDARDNRRRRL